MHFEYVGAGGAQERLVKYLRSKLQKGGDINEHINHKIKAMVHQDCYAILKVRPS